MHRINHVGISGGKDSTALLLWAVYESGYPKESILASFADTGNEAPETYEVIRNLSEKVHPIEIIMPPKDFWDLARHKKRFPSPRARFCTQDLKMKPTKARIDDLVSQGYDVLMHSGVRAAESDDRSKLPDIEDAVSSYFGVPIYRPLLRWSIDDVWAIHKRYGIEPNPLYAMGCKRVGCLPCIMSRKAEIAIIARRWPERIDFIRTQEISVRNGCGYSSVFARDKVPDRYRSKTIVSSDKVLKGAEYTDSQPEMDLDVTVNKITKGSEMRVATIDDVVAWALNDPDLHTESFDFFEDEFPACDSRYGACE